MAIWDYFSSDPHRRARFIFNLIAPIYGMIVKSIERNYLSSIEVVKQMIDIKDTEVLDVGAGTGAWGKLFLDNGAKRVVGIDLAEKMVKVARKKYPEIEFFTCNAEKMSKIPDKSFDIVTSSYVLHGVKSDKRLRILEQMQRIARQAVVIHDFAGKVRLFVQILEALERSDFKNFRKNFCKEMEQVFGNCQVKPTEINSGIYLARMQFKNTKN